MSSVVDRRARNADAARTREPKARAAVVQRAATVIASEAADLVAFAAAKAAALSAPTPGWTCTDNPWSAASPSGSSPRDGWSFALVNGENTFLGFLDIVNSIR